MRKFLLFVYMTLTLICLGCSSKHPVENFFHDYNSSLSNFIGIQIDTLEINNFDVIKYPQRKQILIPIEELRIDFADFLTFKKCNLQELIAIRNNAMGKFMLPSQQLLYETEFIARAKNCLIDLHDEELLPQVNEIIESKVKNLNTLFWNATFGSEEFEDLFNLSASAYEINYDENELSESLSAIKSLHNIIDKVEKGRFLIDEDILESSLSNLSSNNTGGKLTLSAQLLINNLSRTNLLLDSLLKNKQINAKSLSEKRKKFLKNLFYDKYIERLHTYISNINSDLIEFQTSLFRLYTIINQDHGYQFNQFILQFVEDNIDGILNALKSSVNRHTTNWKDIDEKFNLGLIER